MKTKLTLLETLLKKKIPFAVCVSERRFGNKFAELNSKDYFILIKSIDRKKLKKFSFIKSTDKEYLTMEHELNVDELAEFKGLRPLFTKIIHDENGRVYELKKTSFKSYYTV